jgi:hypothetical protein
MKITKSPKEEQNGHKAIWIDDEWHVFLNGTNQVFHWHGAHNDESVELIVQRKILDGWNCRATTDKKVTDPIKCFSCKKTPNKRVATLIRMLQS